MTSCEELEQVLFDEGYKIITRSIAAPFQGLAIKINKHIILNADRNNNSVDRYCTLMHEKGHFECNVFYKLATNCEIARERERIVDIWTVKHLCPQEVLAELLFVKKMTPYEIADELGINESVVQKAYDIYRDLEEWNRVKMAMMREIE